MLKQLITLALLRAARGVAVAVDGEGPIQLKREKTLVVYAYSQHSADAAANARYFLRFGVDAASPDAVFVLVANGCHSVDWPAGDNVIVVERENTCFDFGAWSAGLRAARERGVEFAYAIFLNASVRGPFLPAYEARPWWRVFRDALAQAAQLERDELHIYRYLHQYVQLAHLPTRGGAPHALEGVSGLAVSFDAKERTFLVEVGGGNADGLKTWGREMAKVPRVWRMAPRYWALVDFVNFRCVALRLRPLGYPLLSEGSASSIHSRKTYAGGYSSGLTWALACFAVRTQRL